MKVYGMLHYKRNLVDIAEKEERTSGKHQEIYGICKAI